MTARNQVKKLELELWLITTEPCDHCNSEGKVFCHDPSGDGHGGLNGGSWDYFQCHKCHGKGRTPKLHSSL